MSSISQLITEVKEKLEKEHNDLPLGRNGRDDEELILWFLKDQKYSVNKAVCKLNKTIIWRRDFGLSELSEESFKNVADTGKAYLHDYLDVYNRPVLIVEAVKHLPGETKPYDNKKLCVFLVEKALKKLPDGKEEIIVIVNLQGVGIKNVDLMFMPFVHDLFRYHYPKRLAGVIAVSAPVMIKPFWQMVKPLVKPYDRMARFCSAKNVREEYFTAETVPSSFAK